MPFYYGIIYINEQKRIKTMFGYILPKTCELKVCEYEDYKSYYCGLCKVIRKNYSNYAAMFLSNDCVFMYILFSALSESIPVFKKNACILHGRRCRYKLFDTGDDYAAAICVLLAAAKIKDDIIDTGKQKSKTAAAFMKKAEKKARKKYPEAAKAVDDMMAEVLRLEQEKSSDIDALAHSFACMLGKLFEKADEESWEALYDLGYNIGRYVYLIDAADDMEKDSKSGEFNVFLEKYGSDIKSAKKSARFNLMMSLAQAKNALDRLTIKKNKGILLNIITVGLTEKAHAVLKGEKI